MEFSIARRHAVSKFSKEIRIRGALKISPGAMCVYNSHSVTLNILPPCSPLSTSKIEIIAIMIVSFSSSAMLRVTLLKEDSNSQVERKN